MKIRSFLLAMMLCALCVTQASALEYDFDAPEDYLFGQPTSDDTIYEWENPNVDRSKNAALIAPRPDSSTGSLAVSGASVWPGSESCCSSPSGALDSSGAFSLPKMAV